MAVTAHFVNVHMQLLLLHSVQYAISILWIFWLAGSRYLFHCHLTGVY